MSNNALQEILSKRFSRHTHATNPSVWNAIEKELDAKKSDRMAIWFWVFNGLAASFFVGMIIWQEPIKTSSTFAATEKQSVRDQHSAKKQPSTIVIVPKTEVETGKLSPTINRNPTSTLSAQKEIESRIEKELDQQPLTTEQHQQNAYLVVSSLTSKPVNELDLNPKNNEKLHSFDIANPSTKWPFLRSFYVGIQGAYVHNFRTTKSTPPDAFSSPLTPVDRTFEFTVLSQFELARNYWMGIGFGYASATATSTSLTQQDASSIETSTNYRKSIFILPIQAKYTLLNRNRFSVDAGIIVQPEIVQLSTEQTSEMTPITSITTTNESIMLPPTAEKQKGNQLAMEPFAQFNVLLNPRFSLYTNLGYRHYLKEAKFENITSDGSDKITFNIGLRLRLH